MSTWWPFSKIFSRWRACVEIDHELGPRHLSSTRHTPARRRVDARRVVRARASRKMEPDGAASKSLMNPSKSSCCRPVQVLVPFDL